MTRAWPDELLERVAERAAALVLERLDRADREPAPSEYVTIPEAAELLRARRQRVDDLLAQGRLSRFKDGSRTLISRDEVRRYLAGELVGPIATRLPPTTPGRMDRAVAR